MHASLLSDTIKIYALFCVFITLSLSLSLWHDIDPFRLFSSPLSPLRLCSLTITRLSLLMPLPADLSSLSLAVKMQSSKRTLRSHEIPIPQCALVGHSCTLAAGTAAQQSAGSSGGGGASMANNATAATSSSGASGAAGAGGAASQQTSASASAAANSAAQTQMPTAATMLMMMPSTNSCGAFGSLGGGANGVSMAAEAAADRAVGCATVGCSAPQSGGLLETDLDLHFSLQYPHFIKRDGNR